MTEHEITSMFVGMPVRMENLANCAHKNGSDDPQQYIVYSSGFLYRPEQMQLFGVTPRLKEQWERRGTEFTVSVYVHDGQITSCKINKYNDGEGARPSGGGPLKCTDQDLRIARRILRYITE